MKCTLIEFDKIIKIIYNENIKLLFRIGNESDWIVYIFHCSSID